jgi:3-dehydroquinate synthase
MSHNTIRVKNESSDYSVIVGNNTLKYLPKKIKEISPKAEKIGIVFDSNIPKKYKSKIKKLLPKYKIIFFEYSTSEKLKTFTKINIFLEKCIKHNFNRNDFLIAIGGGIVGDFCGFAASILKRGTNFINIPTTLLAQVDSSVGGKTGVNSQHGKNLIGSFYQPKLVLCDLSFLNSLPKRQMISGYAEILKHAVICDNNFFKWLKLNSKKILLSRNSEALNYAVTKSCKIKLFFTNKDVGDQNVRMTLNFGHTFAHAIEAKNHYSKKINHGEAVLIGMMIATKLSYLKKICNQKTVVELIKVYEKNKLNYKLSNVFKKKEYNKMIDFMITDKKNDDNKINLILLKKIGQTTKPGDYKITPKELKKINHKLSNIDF